MSSIRLYTLLSFAALASFASVSSSASTLPVGYSCSGSCGSLGPNGVVTTPPSGNSTYLYVTTSGSNATGVIPTGGLGYETNGSILTSPTFTVTAGSHLDYSFNFVTSDGSGFPDYAWAELFTSGGATSALLFDATTEPTGNIVPGQGLPTPVATLTPSSVDIIGGGPAWAPLGGYSGFCYAPGCGYTGWVGSDYIIPTAGSYYLEFGVTNAHDTEYDTGLAVDGIAVNNVPIGVTPEPSSLALLGTGVLGLAGVVRRRFTK